MVKGEVEVVVGAVGAGQRFGRGQDFCAIHEHSVSFIHQSRWNADSAEATGAILSDYIEVYCSSVVLEL